MVFPKIVISTTFTALLTLLALMKQSAVVQCEVFSISPLGSRPFYQLHDFTTNLIFSFPTCRIGITVIPTLKSCWRSPMDNVQGGFSSAWHIVNAEESWSVIITQVRVCDPLSISLKQDFFIYMELFTLRCTFIFAVVLKVILINSYVLKYEKFT